MTAARVQRRARIALSATTLVILTLAAHSAASGTLPGLAPTALVTLLAVAFSVAACTRTRGLGWTFAYLLAVEVVLHVVLTVAGGHAHGTEPAPASMPAMLAGHVLAALAAAAVLRHADAVIARWCGLVAHALGVVMPTIAIADLTSARLAPISTAPQRASVATLLHAVARRGPPARLAHVITA